MLYKDKISEIHRSENSYIDDIDLIMKEKLSEAAKLRKKVTNINTKGQEKIKRTKELMRQLKEKLWELNRLSAETAIEVEIQDKETEKLKHEMYKNNK